MARSLRLRPHAADSPVHPATQEANDAVLFARLATDDGQALAALMECYWRPMVGFALGRVHSQDAAEDVVQEAFVRIWERRRELRPQASPRSYLYRVLRNLITDIHRRRQLSHRFAFLSTLCEVDETPSALALLEADEFSAAAESAIAALPERRRDVFILAHLHDLSYREVAEVLGITPRTVANHMTLALAQLRAALASHTSVGLARRRVLRFPRSDADAAASLDASRPADRTVPAEDSPAPLPP